jgi:hypothetical protein
MRQTNIWRLSCCAVALALPLLGVGCRDLGDAAADAALEPMTVPVAALGTAQQAERQIQARRAWDAEGVANEMTVALLLLDGQADPGGAALGESVGCNDRIAFVQVPRESDSGNSLKDALHALLSLKETTWRGFHNALAFSRLQVETVGNRDDDPVVVRLSGELVSSGACDDPRLKRQVEETVRRLAPNFRILLNGSEATWRCFGDLSGNCQ